MDINARTACTAGTVSTVNAGGGKWRPLRGAARWDSGVAAADHAVSLRLSVSIPPSPRQRRWFVPQRAACRAALRRVLWRAAAAAQASGTELVTQCQARPPLFGYSNTAPPAVDADDVTVTDLEHTLSIMASGLGLPTTQLTVRSVQHRKRDTSTSTSSSRTAMNTRSTGRQRPVRQARSTRWVLWGTPRPLIDDVARFHDVGRALFGTHWSQLCGLGGLLELAGSNMVVTRRNTTVHAVNCALSNLCGADAVSSTAVAALVSWYV
jgi:hypothetical protein